MKHEYKIIQCDTSWTGTLSGDLLKALNDPATFADGWEFVQVLGHTTILLRRPL